MNHLIIPLDDEDIKGWQDAFQWQLLLEYSDDQPRDEKGRWAETASPAATARGLARLAAIPDPDPDDDTNPGEIFSGATGVFRTKAGPPLYTPSANEVNQADIDAAPVERVAFSRLERTPDQDVVSRETIAKYIRDPGTTYPVVLRYPNGRHVIFDGHHRLIAQALMGHTSAKVKVIALTKQHPRNWMG